MELTGRLRAVAGRAVGGLPRAFWWLWAATLINRLGAFVPTFLMLYLTVEQGYSTAYAGLVVALSGAGGAFGTLVGGVLADRIGRRPTLLLSQVAACAGTAVLGFVHGRLVIAVMAGLVGLAANATRPAVVAMTADVVPPADRTRAFSLNYWAVSIGFAVSASVAGVLAADSYVLLFVGESAMILLCTLVLFFKVEESRPAGAARTVESKPARLTGVLADGQFMALVGLTFVVYLVQLQASTTLAVSMADSGLSTSSYGLVMALNGVLVVVLQIPFAKAVGGRDPAWSLAVACLLIGWGFALAVFADSVAFYAFTVLVWSIGEIVQTPLAVTMAVELSPAAARGRYQGVFAFALSAAMFVGPAAGGLLLEKAGEYVLWLSCGAAGTVAGIGYFIIVRTTGERRALAAESAVPTEDLHESEQASADRRSEVIRTAELGR